MQVKPDELSRHLRGGLQPAYLICGDETLLVEEAVASVREAAQAAGFSERRVMFAESGFQWGELLAEGASMSLFAERKVIDLRVPSGKVDRAASEILREYLEHPPQDNLLLMRTPRLDRSQRNSAWVKAFDKAGAVVNIWGIDAAAWPRWLERRLAAAGVRLQAEALAAFSGMVEGNLLAAVQEIEKLKLGGLTQPVSLEDLQRSMEDASNYDVFVLVDAVFAGDAARVAHILASLRDAGLSPFAVLGPFVSQIRQLQGGGGWMPRDRARAAEGFTRRIGRLDGVLAECALIDQQGKGQILGDAWQSLERMMLRLCGKKDLKMLGENLASLRR